MNGLDKFYIGTYSWSENYYLTCTECDWSVPERQWKTVADLVALADDHRCERFAATFQVQGMTELPPEVRDDCIARWYVAAELEGTVTKDPVVSLERDPLLGLNPDFMVVHVVGKVQRSVPIE